MKYVIENSQLRRDQEIANQKVYQVGDLHKFITKAVNHVEVKQPTTAL